MLDTNGGTLALATRTHPFSQIIFALKKTDGLSCGITGGGNRQCTQMPLIQVALNALKIDHQA